MKDMSGEEIVAAKWLEEVNAKKQTEAKASLQLELTTFVNWFDSLPDRPKSPITSSDIQSYVNQHLLNQAKHKLLDTTCHERIEGIGWVYKCATTCAGLKDCKIKNQTI